MQLFSTCSMFVCLFFFSLTQLDHSVISGIATGNPEANNKSLIKKWCQAFTNAVRLKYFSCTSLIFKDFKATESRLSDCLCVVQTLINVTVPGPENCTSESLCWVDGNNGVTMINISETYKLQKCMYVCLFIYI